MDNKLKLSIFKRALQSNLKILQSAFVILIMTVITIAFFTTVSKYRDITSILSESFERRDSIIKTAIYNLKADNSEVIQIKEQFQIVEEIKSSYLFVAKKYTSFNYSFSIFSVLSGILGFLLLKQGWDNSQGFFLKSSFLMAFFCSSLFGILPNVFGAKDNIKNNLTKYNYYSGVQLDLYSLPKDNKGYIKRSTTNSLDSLNKELISITKKIKENQDLYFDIYIDKVPSDIKPFE